MHSCLSLLTSSEGSTTLASERRRDTTNCGAGTTTSCCGRRFGSTGQRGRGCTCGVRGGRTAVVSEEPVGRWPSLAIEPVVVDHTIHL